MLTTLDAVEHAVLALHRIDPRLLYFAQYAHTLGRVLQYQHRHMRIFQNVAVAQQPLDRCARLLRRQSLHWYAAADR